MRRKHETYKVEVDPMSASKKLVPIADWGYQLVMRAIGGESARPTHAFRNIDIHHVRQTPIQ
jgi:hypothetical protein